MTKHKQISLLLRKPSEQMKGIKTLVFDLGNVLLDISDRSWFENMQAINPDFNPDAFEAFKKNPKLPFDRGEITETQLLEAYRTALDCPQLRLIEMRHIHQSVLIETPRQSISLLPALRQKFGLVLLSDTDAIHAGWFKRYLPWFSNFHKIMFSFRDGGLKQDGVIFDKLLRMMQLNPGQTLFFDDAVEKILAGKSRGLEVYHVSTDADLHRYLTELLKLTP